MKNRIVLLGVLLFWVFAPNFALCGGVNFPVDGLLGDSFYPRDTGTALSTIGERRNFTTVWSGKYLGVYTTRQKGTGGHPGMDIAGSVGEKIYAVADGEVYWSKCYGDWGGVMVFKHDSSNFGLPAGTTYWSIYAHCRERYVRAPAAGETITVHAGDLIGLMGGKSTDICHGESTGRHLHFQIDTGSSFSQPYWPSGNDGNSPDITRLNANTKDPIAFLVSQGGYSVGRHEYYGWFFVDGFGTTPPAGPRQALPSNIAGFWSEPFADCFRYNGGMEKLGRPITGVRGLSNPGEYYYQELRDSGNNNRTLVLNNFATNTNQQYLISGHYKLGVCFVLEEPFRSYWHDHKQALGPPITHWYATLDSNGHSVAVQWFEPSDNNYVVVVWDYLGYYNGAIQGYGTEGYFGINRYQAQFDQDLIQNTVGGQGGGIDADAHPPQNLTSELADVDKVQLAWSQGDSTPEAGVSFRIYRKVNSGNYAVLTETANTTYVDTSLSQGTTYCYKNTAFNQGGESDYSNETCVTTQSIAAPIANFTQDRYTATSTMRVYFYDASQGEVSNWLYEFGDGSSLTQNNTSHRYNPGLYRTKLTVTGPGGQSVKVGTYITVIKESMPSPWWESDLSESHPNNIVGYDSGTGRYTIFTQNTDMWNGHDACSFVYYAPNNNPVIDGGKEIVIKVTKINSPESWAKAGLMIREFPETGRPYVALAATKENGIVFEHALTNRVSGGSYSLPIWLKLKRIGNTFAGFKSSDGLSWTLVASTEISMASEAAYGFFATAVNSNTVAEAEFSDVSIVDVVTVQAPQTLRIVAP